MPYNLYLFVQILFYYLFGQSHDYSLAIILQHLESVIKSRIPGIQSLITKATAELETELCHLGKPIAADSGVRLLHVISIRIDDFYLLNLLESQSFAHSMGTWIHDESYYDVTYFFVPATDMHLSCPFRLYASFCNTLMVFLFYASSVGHALSFSLATITCTTIFLQLVLQFSYKCFKEYSSSCYSGKAVHYYGNMSHVWQYLQGASGRSVCFNYICSLCLLEHHI